MIEEPPAEPEVINPATEAVLASNEHMAEILYEVWGELRAIKDSLRRRERPAPSIFELGSDVTVSKVRLRVTHFVIAVNAAGEYGLETGEFRRFTLVANGPYTLAIPLPILIDGGIDLYISGTPANIVNAYVSYYPE